MARYKIFDINTTAGKRFSVGLFEDDELMKGISQPYYKTKKGAIKKKKELESMRGDW